MPVQVLTAPPSSKKWDIWLTILGALLLPLILYVVAGLDRGAEWSALPFWLQVVALVGMVLGIAITDWAMWANRFFSGTVRIQEDRGHTVAAGGPYRAVRHPGYVGTLVFEVFTPLLLGSWWAWIPGLLSAVLLLVRTALEDRTLQEELEGYEAYARQVRYRLLPGLW